MFGTKNLEFDTHSIATQMPILEEKIGKHKALEMEISLRDIKVMFGQFDSDVLLEYTLHYQFFSKNDKTMLISDSVNMITAMNIKTVDDVLYPTILNHKSSRGGKSNIPKNNMGLTQNEYTRYVF